MIPFGVANRIPTSPKSYSEGSTIFKVTRPYFISLLQTFELSLLFFFSFPLFLLLVCFLKKFQLSTGFTESEPLYTLCNQDLCVRKRIETRE